MNTVDVNTHLPVIVSGKPMTDMPADLFIPPDALEVLLDSFTGPLDLLLYLIRRQNLDILDIPVALITKQYMQYIHLMGEHRLELAADYLVMAAMLAEIKSRLLLPSPVLGSDDIEEDPRLALVHKLQVYEQFKQAAIQLDELPRCHRDIFRVALHATGLKTLVNPPVVSLMSLVTIMQELIAAQDHHIHHQVNRELLSVRAKMADVLLRLEQESYLSLSQLLVAHEKRAGLAVTLLAILELARQSLLVVTQVVIYGPVYVRAIEHE